MGCEIRVNENLFSNKFRRLFGFEKQTHVKKLGTTARSIDKVNHGFPADSAAKRHELIVVFKN